MTKNEERTKRAIVRLSEQMIAAILELPEGVRVCGVRDDFMSMSVLVCVEGDALPVEPTPEGACAPELPVEYSYDVVEQRLRFKSPLAG